MWEIIITSSVLILGLAVLRRVCQGKISGRLQYSLWILVAVRLLVPIPVFGNRFSVMNVVSSMAGEQEGEAGTWTVDMVSAVRQRNGPEPEKAEETGTETGTEEEKKAENGTEAEGKAKEEGGTEAEGEGQEETGTGAKVEGQEETGTGVEGEEQEENRTGEAGEKETGGRRAEGEKEAEGTGIQGGAGAYSLLRIIWVTGMAVMALWMLACNLLFRLRLCRERRFLYRRGRLRVYEAAHLDSPCLCGVVAPAVYLNQDSLLKPCHREHALAHEMTHYRHGDSLWTGVRNLCLVIYWFHPLVWLAACLSGKDCELACDEGTLNRLGEEQRESYGRTLIELACAASGKKRILQFVRELSGGKKELKERIAFIASGRRKKSVLAVLAVGCAAALAACSIGGAKEEETGRYVEASVSCPDSGDQPEKLVWEGDTVRLAAGVGADLVSTDGGRQFTAAEMPYNLSERNIAGATLAVAPDGARAFMEITGNSQRSILITGDGREIILDSLGDSYTEFYYGTGFFYVFEERWDQDANGFYSLDPDTGALELLLEQQCQPCCMAADGKLLYLLHTEGALLYDLEKRAAAEKQDQVLSEFIAASQELQGEGSVLAAPWGDGIYLLTRGGIFWHKLYEETVERVMEGSLYAMGDRAKELKGMAVLQTEGEPEFLVLCGGRQLMRYTYDPSIPAEPEVFRIYSVYGDSQVARAVSEFRALHPELTVVYEIGMDSAMYGRTLKDVLSDLATRIGAGKGPDVLLMDDLPYESYAEKGALADLSSLREKMDGETYFLNVIDAFAGENGLPVIPMTFAVPVLGGDMEAITGVETLAGLAELLEKERESGREDFVFCNWDAADTLQLLAQSSQGAWMTEGELDSGAVGEFLTQAKRIFQVQFSGTVSYQTENEGIHSVKHTWGGLGLGMSDGTQYPLARRFDTEGIWSEAFASKYKSYSYGEAPFYAGFVSGCEKDFRYFQAVQRMFEESFVWMPGQSYGTCLASGLLAVNSKTEYPEESMAFVEYAVSRKFQGGNELCGTPVNREACLAKQGREIRDNDFLEGVTPAGEGYFITLDWPAQEEYRAIDSLIESITGVNRCDTMVYEAVMEYGTAVLKGEMDVPEAVKAIEEKVKIYLAE
ncbi:MAG TPA: hypothetical protein DCZ91_22850 [Lachnospiraceae bacterium]|nr:hypothetical protein [Lachnospiraceae bacterium]